MLDNQGYRPNVGIILINKDNQVFWGRRKGEYSWQFPQGGLCESETLDECMYRELNEELGLFPEHVKIVAKTEDWLYYDVPGTLSKLNSNYRGQKQIWYLLRFVGREHHINLRHFVEQEFDAWRWINYWDPIDQVVQFKQDVYRKALTYLVDFVNE
ncbi:MAG: RNA pyrophosphohydrolase [Proteobacteria bacterium]|nr:MAG: RNA pyrophosphohydrolase [Pseudomonadota bacterium]